MEHGVVLLLVGGRRGIYLKNLLWITWMLTAKKKKTGNAGVRVRTGQ